MRSFAISSPPCRAPRLVFRLLPALLLASPPLLAQVPEYPLRKPGFWELTVRVEGVAQKAQQCVDAASDRLLQHHFVESGDCKTSGPRKQGDAVLVDLACSVMDRKVATRMVIRGDFQSKTHTEIRQTWTPPIEGMPGRMVVEGRWAGACPAGWKPGDHEAEEIRLNVMRSKEIQDLANDLMKGGKRK